MYVALLPRWVRERYCQTTYAYFLLCRPYCLSSVCVGRSFSLVLLLFFMDFKLFLNLLENIPFFTWETSWSEKDKMQYLLQQWFCIVVGSNYLYAPVLAMTPISAMSATVPGLCNNIYWLTLFVVTWQSISVLLPNKVLCTLVNECFRLLFVNMWPIAEHGVVQTIHKLVCSG